MVNRDMKILNKTYRDVTAEDPQFQTTTIEDLSKTTELKDGSLIHIVENDGSNNFESKKMLVDDFKQKVYESVQNTFKTAYWETHELISKERGSSYLHDQNEEEVSGERPKGTSFKELLEYLRSKDNGSNPIYAPEEIAKDAEDGFVKHIYFDFDLIKRYMVAKDNDIIADMEDIGGNVDVMDCQFSPIMSFATTRLDNNIETVVTNDSVNHDLTENDNYCQMSISKISSEWKCPASGNLVIYGWLDASQCLNNKSTPAAFCAIEGNINGNWEIISVCAVNPTKSMTYVGFNLTVKKGLTIRARTGFTCGAKSGQFSNEQDGNDTLSNSTANGFKCMIFSNKEGLDIK